MDRDTSSRRNRDDRDRDTTKDHHRQRDRDRDGEHRHHQRDRDGDEKRRDSDHHHHRSDHRSSRREDRESSRERESKRERSYDRREDREGSKDRAPDRESKRERSHEPRSEREGSRDGDSKRERSNEPRCEREDSRDRDSKRERLRKREGSRDRDSKRERSRDREESRDMAFDSRELMRRSEREESRDGGKHHEVKREEGSFEDWEGNNQKEVRNKRKERDEEIELREGEKRARASDKRRERRRFEGSVKEEAVDVDGHEEGKGEARGGEIKLKEERDDDNGAVNGFWPVADGSPPYPASMASGNVPKSSMAPSQPFSTKVSSISTTNENKGVNITRSHEVPGKSSTDGTSSAAGKSSGNLSLDALAKAKRALQMQKELAEKLKKIPFLNKGTKSIPDGSPHRGVSGYSSSTTTTTSISAGAISNSSSLSAATTASAQQLSGAPGLAGLGTIPNIEAVKRAQELAAKMGFRQDPEFAPLINLFPGQAPTEAAAPQKPTKVPVLRVDAFGREIDEHGNVINVTKPSTLSTLKVNINKQKKDAFQILKPQLEVDPESNSHFDPRMGIDKNKLLRPKRMTFQFVEEGKWSRDAENLKLKSQFGEAKAKELKAKAAQLAKAKADINPNLIEVSERVITKEKPKAPIPEAEWWDLPLLINGSYGEIADGSITEDKLKLEKINLYVEHPRPIEPPAEPAPPPPQPLKLTKKEQKKLRTQRRLAREKERQEMIRQGLLEPPKPKVKMSNLMKVLGSEATQDPTRLEKEIRTAAAEREQAHIDRNTARKLTPAERREKKERKLFDDSNTLETIVAVYKINELSHPKARFKVDMNARENRLTGCAVISEGMTVVVVEGGNKSIKRYGKLMLRRINWAEAVKDDEENREEEEAEEEEDKPVNKCVLVWQGSVAKPCFYKFSIHECLTEAAARKVFADAGVGHYWDLAVNYTEE